MDTLLEKVKANLILEHSADDALLQNYITAAVSYAESYQHIQEGYYTENAMPATTEQAVIMLASHFYESRDGSTGGFFAEHSRSGTRSTFCFGSTGNGRCDMSFGKMNTFISIVEKQFTQDDEGFKTETDVTVAEVRAYREGRHGSEKWANMASFSTATDLFQFRVIPGVTVTTDMRILCDGHTFEITSVENVKGRGMYLEVLGTEVKSGG